MNTFAQVGKLEWERLDAAIAHIKERGENAELSIHFDDSGSLEEYRWSIQISNPCLHVSLGESIGRYCGHGADIEAAIEELEVDIYASK